MRAQELASFEMIERLIGFDTTSRLSNLALIDWVKTYLGQFGADIRLTYDSEGKKANLFATLGEAGVPGIVLSGHTDVVPVDGQPWDTDPFKLTERDGKLYGRGTCDMKSFLAVALAMVPEFVRRGLKTPLHLSLSYDEEVGCKGVPGLIADLKQAAISPLACIVGEPTSMKVITGHKGKLGMRARVRGLECHSSIAPSGVNAVEYAAEAIAFLKNMMRKRQKEGPFNADYDPPFTTIHTGVVQGGTAINIVPLDCYFDFEFRVLPTDDPHVLLAELQHYVDTVLVPEMRAISPDSGFTFEKLSAFPGLSTDEDAMVSELAKGLAGSNDTAKVGFGTEGGLFAQSGIPTIVCGPGSIEQAHKPNEFVAVDQVAQCERFMHRLMDRMCAA